MVRRAGLNHATRAVTALSTAAVALLLFSAMRPMPRAELESARVIGDAGSGLVITDAEFARVMADIERTIAAGDPVTLDWKAMAALNYKTGEMPASLRKLNGVVVRIPGFMVPLEDTETRVTEFLLVPYFGACIHVPPPPPNQMAHVLMQKSQAVEVNLWDPIWIIGKLTIENVESPYGMVGFQVAGERIRPYDG